MRRGVTLLAQPQNAPVAAKLTWATVDAIWRACGDRSHDYNYYTKRGLLSGVWTSTLLYWLNDRSEGDAATWAFLDRRIGDVMRIPKLTAPFKKAAARFPSPLRVLERLRAGNPFPSRRASGPTSVSSSWRPGDRRDSAANRSSTFWPVQRTPVLRLNDLLCGRRSRSGLSG